MIAPRRVILMKAGFHLNEEWSAIVRRKLAEEQTAGVAYWGYGGTVCHPITQVQPFARESDEPTTVLMIPTKSPFRGEAEPAVTASADGVSWYRVPVGIRCTGTYALILRS